MTQLLLASAPASPRPELVYLLIAALCLTSALYFLRVAVAPVAAFVRATVAAMLVALTISAALVLLTLAAVVR
jgi:hypothetical protein